MGSIEIIDSKFLYEKAQRGLMELSMSLGLEVMRMMLEEEVEKYAGPKGESTTHRSAADIATEQKKPL